MYVHKTHAHTHTYARTHARTHTHTHTPAVRGEPHEEIVGI
jgi:hypothetical protein